MDYKEKYEMALERAKKFIEENPLVQNLNTWIKETFPELKESEDEKTRKEIIRFIRMEVEDEIVGNKWLAWLEKQGEKSPSIIWHNINEEPEEMKELFCEWESDDATWHDVAFYDEESKTFRHAKMPINVTKWVYVDELLEKQGEQKHILNVPTRDIILSIWNLGNEWKELTNGCISTEYGTQLNYIQKHWHESEYYLKEKQSEQNLIDKIEPKFKVGDWITNGDYTWKIVEIKPLDYILQSQDGNIVDDTISHVDEQFHSFTIQDAKEGDVLCYETENELRIFIYKNGHIHYHCHYCNEHLTTVDSFFVVEKYLLCYIHPATQEQRDLLFQKMKEAGYEWDADKKELKKSNSYCQEHCKGFQETGKCFADGDCKDKREAEQNHTEWSQDDEKMLADAYIMLDWYKGNNWWAAQYIKDWLKSIKQRIGG